MRAVMSADQYRRHGISGAPGHFQASLAAPSDVTEMPLIDGRRWGDDGFIGIPISAATAEQAARASAVNFCVSLIGEAMGSTPLDFMEGDRPASAFTLADVLSYNPNPLQVGAEFWAAMVYAAALRGVAFAEPVAAPEGLEIWPLDPLRTHVDWRDRGFTVTHQDDSGFARHLGPGNVFWITGLGDGRIQPLTPWKQARGVIDFALALENQGRSSFQNGNRPGGVLESDEELTAPVIDRLTASMKSWRRGGNAVLEQGLKFKPVQADNSASQFAELIDQCTQQMARYWRIPRTLIDGTGKTTEQETTAFVMWVLRPLARRIEQAIFARLFTPEMRRHFRPKFNLNAYLRGDSATQARNNVLYRTAGTHSINDCRAIMGLPPIDEPWADDVRAPLNSNRAADTMTGGETAPQDDDKVGTDDA